MQAYTFTLNGNAQQLSSLIDGNDYCQSVSLENPIGNGAINYGDSSIRPFTLLAGIKVNIPITSTKNLWLSGVNTELVHVLVFG